MFEKEKGEISSCWPCCFIKSRVAMAVVQLTDAPKTPKKCQRHSVSNYSNKAKSASPDGGERVTGVLMRGKKEAAESSSNRKAGPRTPGHDRMMELTSQRKSMSY
jgi:hypothetical protein